MQSDVKIAVSRSLVASSSFSGIKGLREDDDDDDDERAEL
jgi:hypothetical protein